MDKPDVFMPLYIGDYLAGTSRLSTEQHGAYLLMMMDYWMNGPLPDNDHSLANIARLSPDAWSMHKHVLAQFFTITSGEWRQKRIEQELANAYAKKAKAQEKAKKAADARWGKQSTSNATSIAQANHEECPSPSPSPSPINKPKTPPKPPKGVECELFKAFWSAYPRKTQKPLALKAWEKLKPSEELADIILSSIFARLEKGEWSVDRKQFIPHPATFLNQARWEDEIIPRQDGPQKPKPETGPEFLASRFDRTWADGMREPPSTPKNLPPGGTQ